MAHYQQPLPPHSLPPPPATGMGHSSFSDLNLATILEDLCARFIVNLPAEELESMDRVCFQIEQAHWYYEDFIRPTASNPTLLPSYGLKAFSLLMFKSCPLLHDLVPSHGKIWTSFMAYKERVPVCGAIMISEYWDKVLLVKGWNKGSSWSFPRGKINKQEPEAMCAVREVLEETGFDLTSYFPPHQLHPSYAGEEEGVERVPYYVELVIREQKIRLYFVPNVPEATRFETRTRKEISKIDWFPLSALPTWNQNQRGGKNPGSMRSKGELANGKQAKYYMVTPFISHLKLWVDRNKPKGLPSRPSPSSSSIPLSPEAASPRPLNPTPHHAALKMHPLVPWDDATYHLPSETELDHSDAGETSATTSTEDEAESEDDFARLAAASPTWQTRQQGTEALQALFFGAPPQAGSSSDLLPPPTLPSSSTSSLSQHTTPPARPLPIALQHHASSSSLTEAAATPPQVAYERQQSFLQPRPRPSESQQGQQARLLELLTGQELATPPPLALSSPSTGPQADGTGSLLGLLNGMNLTSASPAHDSYPSSSQAHASLLFGGAPSASTGAYVASPPPEMFGTVESVEGRSEEEKREKHQALLRALFNVAVKSPDQPPPMDDFGVDPLESGTPRSDEIEALFGSAPGSGLGSGSQTRKSTLRAGQTIDLDDDEPWPPTVVPPPHNDASLFYSLPNRQLVAETPLTQSVTSVSGGWHSLSSSDEASNGSRRPHGAAGQAPTGSTRGKGSLLAILNQPGNGYHHEPEAAVSSPSAYSQHSGGAPGAREPEVKDPLQVLREYRNRQHQQETGTSLPSPPTVLAQPVASLPPPQPEPVYAPIAQQGHQPVYHSPPQPQPVAPAPLAPQAVYPHPQHTSLPPPSAVSQPFLASPAYPAAPPLPGQAYQQPLPPASYSHLPFQPQPQPAYSVAPPALPPQQPYPTSYAPPQHLPPSMAPPNYPSYPQPPPPGSYPLPQPHALPPQHLATAAQHPLPPRQGPLPLSQPPNQPFAAAQHPLPPPPSFGGQQPLPPFLGTAAGVPAGMAGSTGGKPNAGALLGLLNAKG